MSEEKEKIDSDSELWRKRAYSLARSYCPAIYSCCKCGNPVVSGYCCSFCGDDNPSSNEKSE